MVKVFLLKLNIFEIKIEIVSLMYDLRWGVYGKVEEFMMLFGIWWFLLSIFGLVGDVSFFFSMVVIIICNVEIILYY